MNKIGILSMQKVMNHGSFLQSFALLQCIKKMRPEVDVLFIDIKPDTCLYTQKDFLYSFKKLWKKLLKPKEIIRYISRIFFSKIYTSIFEKYWHEYLGITDEHNWNTTFDTVVIGSDEAFNCTQNAPWGFSKNLLGEGLNSDNIITYAASCGHTTISKVEDMHLVEDVERAFKNIKHFSVRDENTYQFIKRFAGREALIHIDPVFLFNYEPYIKTIKPLKKNFILIYSYNFGFSNQKDIDAIRSFAKKNHLKVISAFGIQSWCENIILEPFELLTYFKQAAYIITDTFHGTALSIKYNKQFVSFIRYDITESSNHNKLCYLLKKFELQDREIKNVDNLSQKITQKIDFESVNKILDEQIQKSIEYLDQYL
jgi:hypothetical protein